MTSGSLGAEPQPPTTGSATECDGKRARCACGHPHSADPDGGPGPCWDDACTCDVWVTPIVWTAPDHNGHTFGRCGLCDAEWSFVKSQTYQDLIGDRHVCEGKRPAPSPPSRSPDGGEDARRDPPGTLVTCEHCPTPHPKDDDGRPCLYPKRAAPSQPAGLASGRAGPLGDEALAKSAVAVSAAEAAEAPEGDEARGSQDLTISEIERLVDAALYAEVEHQRRRDPIRKGNAQRECARTRAALLSALRAATASESRLRGALEGIADAVRLLAIGASGVNPMATRECVALDLDAIYRTAVNIEKRARAALLPEGTPKGVAP